MQAGDKKRIVCSALFHTVALACVVWSLYVLIGECSIYAPNTLITLTTHLTSHRPHNRRTHPIRPRMAVLDKNNSRSNRLLRSRNPNVRVGKNIRLPIHQMDKLQQKFRDTWKRNTATNQPTPNRYTPNNTTPPPQSRARAYKLNWITFYFFQIVDFLIKTYKCVTKKQYLNNWV